MIAYYKPLENQRFQEAFFTKWKFLTLLKANILYHKDFPSLFQDQDQTLLAKTVLSEFLVHTKRIKISEENLAVLVCDEYWVLIQILEQMKLYDQATTVINEIIGIIERVTQLN